MILRDLSVCCSLVSGVCQRLYRENVLQHVLFTILHSAFLILH